MHRPDHMASKRGRNPQRTLISSSLALAAWLAAMSVPSLGQINTPADAGVGGLIKSGDEEIAKRLEEPEEVVLPSQLPVGIDTVKEVAAILDRIQGGLPEGAPGRASPWFLKLQTLKSGRAQAAASKFQSALFAQIPLMAEAFEADQDARPAFMEESVAALHSLSAPMLHGMTRFIEERNGSIAAENLNRFVTVFSVEGFVSEADWEDQPQLLDAAGLVVLDGSAVVAHFKAQPWARAERFLAGKNATDAFSRYGASGDGHALLKAKYAAAQPATVSRWSELAGWVAQQREASQ